MIGFIEKLVGWCGNLCSMLGLCLALRKEKPEKNSEPSADHNPRRLAAPVEVHIDTVNVYINQRKDQGG